MKDGNLAGSEIGIGVGDAAGDIHIYSSTDRIWLAVIDALPVKKWSESRAAAPKGRYPVEYRGNFQTF